MPALRIIGNELVGVEQFVTGDYAEKLMLKADVAAFSADGPVAAPALPVASDDITPLPPIAFGQPLTIDIRHANSGRIGHKPIIGRTGDIAVVSGVKDWSTFKASARALNFVAQRAGRQTNMPGPNALQDGTRIVAYQKAVATRQINVAFEMVDAPSAGQSLLTSLGSAFTAAAGVPLFLPYAGALLAAGQIVPMVGDLIDQLSDPSPWSANVDINFGLPGTRPTRAEFQVVIRDESAVRGFRFEAGSGLVDSAGRPYAGDEPYVVIAVYGGAMPELEAFTPSVMSAELASRFYRASKGAQGVFDDLLGIVKVASDVKYRGIAEGLQRRLKDLDPASEEYKKTKEQLDAVLANILDPTLKPKSS